MTAGLIIVVIAWAVVALTSAIVSAQALALMAYMVVTGLFDMVQLAVELCSIWVRGTGKELRP